MTLSEIYGGGKGQNIFLHLKRNIKFYLTKKSS